MVYNMTETNSHGYSEKEVDVNYLIDINDKQLEACEKNIRVLNYEMHELWHTRIGLLQRRKAEKK